MPDPASTIIFAIVFAIVVGTGLFIRHQMKKTNYKWVKDTAYHP